MRGIFLTHEALSFHVGANNHSPYARQLPNVFNRTKQHISNISGQADPWAILMVSIASFFCLLIIAPLLVVFWLSFFDGSLLDPVIKYSWKNYLTVFAEPFTYNVLFYKTRVFFFFFFCFFFFFLFFF